MFAEASSKSSTPETERPSIELAGETETDCWRALRFVEGTVSRLRAESSE